MHLPIRDQMLKTFESFYENNSFILGEKVKQFEDAYSKFNNTKYTIGISNGLDALCISLLTLGIGDGDEVIIPSNTFIATALAISHVGATPVFVEPKIDTFNINPNLIEPAITKKTKAIIPVHLYGQACEMSKICEIAQNNSLYIVEDNAQSQGASYSDRFTGAWGDINATSFYPGKNLGALGDAGAITSNNELFAKKAKILRNYGSEKKYFNDIIGYNMRLDECQAAFLEIKLKYLTNWNTQRQQIAQWYKNHLKDLNEIKIPTVANMATHVYHLFVIRVEKRNELQNYLSEKGIGTLIHYPVPPHLQKAYNFLGFKKGDFPIAEDIAKNCISLPIYPGLLENQVYYICEKIKKFYA